MAQMTIHRGLAELKLLDARISKQIREINPIGFKQRNKKVDNRFDEEEFIKIAKSDFDSVTTLIDRKNKIKTAIVKSNTETSIKIADKTMAVADAINFKTLVAYKKELINVLRTKQTQVLAVYNRNNETVQANVQKLLEAALGKDGSKNSEKTAIESISKPFLDINEFHLIDPLKLDEKIKEIEKEVTDFETEVDAALSTVNATTFIEID